MVIYITMCRHNEGNIFDANVLPFKFLTKQEQIIA